MGFFAPQLVEVALRLLMLVWVAIMVMQVQWYMTPVKVQKEAVDE